jgi:8-oxo-dGTP diphosphatase
MTKIMFFPNFTIFLLLNADNQVLLLRRINTPFCEGCYSLPGGKIEYGETARETVIREARDSLGIDITLDDIAFKHIMYRKCNEPEFFACVFQVNSPNHQPINNQPDRHDIMEWFDMQRLPEKMVPAHRYAIEQIVAGQVYSEHGWAKGCV